MQLNELDEEIEAVIPKTDCRLRPDVRAMENGDIGNVWIHMHARLMYNASGFNH